MPAEPDRRDDAGAQPAGPGAEPGRRAAEPGRGCTSAALIDPVPAADAIERGAMLALHAQERWLEHCMELGWAMGVFATRRAACSVAAARKIAAQPTPEVVLEACGHAMAEAAGDLADEAARAAHVSSAFLAETARTLRRETGLAIEAFREPEID